MLANGASLPWSIGIDLSHTGQFSRIAAALISDEGRFVHGWTIDQQRAENIESAKLRRLLSAATNAISTAERTVGMLILRDGRVFENEKIEDYCDWNGPVTFAEIRKGRNPPLLIDTGQLVDEPTVAWLPNAGPDALGFLVTTAAEKGKFNRPLKVLMRKERDGMGLGAERLARTLIAQTLTPGLGLKSRRLPAPLYWADGIAGASNTDLRFRGQSVTVLDSRRTRK